ncbi:MAG: hypothetical protein WC838_02420 [Candidatus Margulisiibacteriota bacterium]|jgi:hypothetical protein
MKKIALALSAIIVISMMFILVTGCAAPKKAETTEAQVEQTEMTTEQVATPAAAEVVATAAVEAEKKAK